jgi:hypothetical protein
MKTLGILILAILGARLSGQVLLNDNFSGGSLDTGKWQTILPTGSSSISQSGGVLTTTGRGILATANPFFHALRDFGSVHDAERPRTL